MAPPCKPFVAGKRITERILQEWDEILIGNTNLKDRVEGGPLRHRANVPIGARNLRN